MIFIHGGKNYSSGNNLTEMSADPSVLEPDNLYKFSTSVNLYAILTCAMAIKNSVKPIVGLVQGWCVGIAFTLSSLFTFLYCTPDAKFIAPFSKSFQIPEGSSTYSFPAIFGQRKANELLFLSQTLDAAEAKRYKFVNDVLTSVQAEGSTTAPSPSAADWPDLSKIPAIGKLLASDQKTVENCMSLINAARDNNRLDAAIWRELKKCVDNNMDPEFIPKMMQYMAQTLGKSKGKALGDAKRPKL